MYRNTIKFLTLAICLLLSTAARSQLFTTLTDQQADLSQAQLDKLQELRSNPSYESVTAVTVGDIFSLQNNGSLAINIPGLGTGNALVSNVENDWGNSTDFVWEGMFYDYYADEDNNNVQTLYFDGSVHFFKKDGEIFGRIDPLGSDDMYELASLGSGKNVLIKFTNQASNQEYGSCETSIPSSEITPLKTSGGCNTTVRVLILTTEKGRAAVSNISNTITTAMGLLNGAIYNSTNHAGGINFVLAGVENLSNSQFNERSYPYIDAATTVLAANSYAQYYRNQYKADLVVCLTDGNFNRNMVGWSGTNFQLSEKNSYAIVDADAANVSFAFAHEIGHLFTARHQQSTIDATDPDNAPGPAHGYGFVRVKLFSHKSYVDIMCAQVSGVTRQHYYSNPNVKIWGHDMGTANDNYVTKVMLDNVCTVSEFRSDDNALPYYTGVMSSKYIYNPSETVVVTATNFNAFGTITHNWYISYDGGSTYSSLGTTYSPNHSISFTMPSGTDVIIKKVSTTSVGQTHTKQRVIRNGVTIIPAGGTTSPINMNKKAPESIDENPALPELAMESSKMSMKLSPNPAKNEVKILFSYSGNSIGKSSKVTVMDALGKIVFEEDIKLDGSPLTIGTSKFASGAYFVKVVCDNDAAQEKLIIEK